MDEKSALWVVPIRANGGKGGFYILISLVRFKIENVANGKPSPEDGTFLGAVIRAGGTVHLVICIKGQ